MNPSIKTLTDEVVAQFQLRDARAGVVIAALIRHLHEFAGEVTLTHAEWRTGLRFLTGAARITDDRRNEFSLLSDVFGMSSAVDLIASPPGATPGSVLGPFHAHDSEHRDNGSDLRGEQPGQPTLFCGQVRSSAGAPLVAQLDFWQNADNGLYPQQDAAQDQQNLRCKLVTDDEGRFTLRTVLPRPYGIPEDGPVGALMRAAQRRCMRPAHFHLIVTAPGHHVLTTEIFFAGDPYLETDAVFGVRPGLIAQPESVTDAAIAQDCGMPSPFLRVTHDLVLAPLPTK